MTFNPNNEDIILGEYLLAILIYDGQSLNKILDKTDEIEDKKEREDVKLIIINLVLDFINLNPQNVYLLNDKDGWSKRIFKYYWDRFFLVQ